MEHGNLPDPIADAIQFVLTEQKKLEKRIKELESKENKPVELREYLNNRPETIEAPSGVSEELIKKGTL